MKLEADESVQGPIVRALRAAGHDVYWINENRKGAADVEVLEIAEASERILVTTDRDFGEIVFKEGLAHAGVVLLRLGQMPTETRGELAVRFFNDHPDFGEGSFAVITVRGVRIRMTFDDSAKFDDSDEC